MALFTDGPISLDTDLVQYENGILALAAEEQIDLTGKMALAQTEIGTRLLALLLRQETRSPFTNWIDPQDMLRREIGMGDVVVTDPLKQWHVLKTLALVYRDAYNNQLNDRYQKKWQEYSTLEQNAKEMVYLIGVGVVGYPLPVPGMPAVAEQPGTGPGGTFFFQTTWVNQLGQESTAGLLATAVTAPGVQITVTPTPAPKFATGWNVYAGNGPQVCTLQNAAPRGLSEGWTAPGSGLVTGRAPGKGQTPDYYVMNDRVLPRG
jgi:hypothetical protein